MAGIITNPLSTCVPIPSERNCIYIMAQSQQSSGQQPNPMFVGFDVPGPVLPSSDSVTGLGVSIVFGVAAIVAVALRLWAQRRTKAGITIDAYLIIAALVSLPPSSVPKERIDICR